MAALLPLLRQQWRGLQLRENVPQGHGKTVSNSSSGLVFTSSSFALPLFPREKVVAGLGTQVRDQGLLGAAAGGLRSCAWPWGVVVFGPSGHSVLKLLC